MMSECFSGLEHAVAAFVPQLLPTFLKFTNDSNADVRNNAIFGIGELAFHGKEAVYSYPFNKVCSLHFIIITPLYLSIYIYTPYYQYHSHYPDILQVLSSAIAKESHVGARDNVLGAIARLIIVNYGILPLDQVFPVFVNQLPLKEDFQENKAVFRSILTLYQAGHNILQSHMRALLQVAISVLQEGKTTDDGTF